MHTPPATDQATVTEAVAESLDRDIRPIVQAHAGDVTLERVSGDGTVQVRFHAACSACPLIPVTFYTLVRRRLLAVDGVREVECGSVRVSPHAQERLKHLHRRGSEGS